MQTLEALLAGADATPVPPLLNRRMLDELGLELVAVPKGADLSKLEGEG